jgi:hypothetical protein
MKKLHKSIQHISGKITDAEIDLINKMVERAENIEKVVNPPRDINQRR